MRTRDGGDHAGKLREHPVAHEFHDASAMRRKRRFDDGASHSHQPRKRPRLVALHKRAIAGQVGREDDGEAPLHARQGYGALERLRQADETDGVPGPSRCGRGGDSASRAAQRRVSFIIFRAPECAPMNRRQKNTSAAAIAGDVRYKATVDASVASSCNCSICMKLGVLGAIVKPEAFRLLSDEAKLASYSRAPEIANRFFCARCHVHCFGKGNLPRIGRRLRLGEPEHARRFRSVAGEHRPLGRSPGQLERRVPLDAVAGSMMRAFQRRALRASVLCCAALGPASLSFM